MKHIKWNYKIVGVLDNKEKQLCEEIDALCSVIIRKGQHISIVISIEGGNQFHIRDANNCNIISYLSAEQCKYALISMLATINLMQK